MDNKAAQRSVWVVWIGIFVLQLIMLMNCGSEESTDPAENSASMSIIESGPQNLLDPNDGHDRGNPNQQEGNISGHDDRRLCPSCLRTDPPIRRPIIK